MHQMYALKSTHNIVEKRHIFSIR